MAKIVRGIVSVIFGNYPQAGYGTVKPIEWVALKEEGNKALLISKYILKRKRFDEKTNVWADSELRQWMNQEFLDAAFTDDEKAAILETELPDVGTVDKVFLLSLEEAKTLINDKKNRVMLGGRHCWWWWLRSPGNQPDVTAIVDVDGSLHSGSVHYGGGVVRPALWVNLDSDIFKS